jgi:flagellar biosynthesis protein FlhB
VFKFALQPERLRDSEHLDNFMQAAGAFTWTTMLATTLPLCIILAATALLTRFLQVGPLFSMQAISPRFERLNPAAGLKNIFLPPRTYQQLALNTLKLCLVLVLVLAAVQTSLPEMTRSLRLGLTATTAVFADFLTSLLWKCVAICLLFGLCDFLLQRRSFLKQHGMDRDT